MSDRAHIHLLEGFDDPRLSAVEWGRLLDLSSQASVFQTREWLSAWWRCFGRGRLLVVVANRGGMACACAPLFADGGEIYFVGSGGSDYLDFIGDLSNGAVMAEVLSIAAAQVPGFVGCKFYLVPDESPTGAILQAAADRLGWALFDEGSLNAPVLDFAATDDRTRPAAANKTSLVRHERALRREGEVRIEHLTRAAEIAPHLESFFDQHVRRWAGTPFPSLFNDERQRAFYRTVTHAADGAGWLRFTRVLWSERLVAAHFGFHFRETFLWYKPTFEIELSRRSPGEVLLRNLILHAASNDARTFDFGIGDEAFKMRFANRVRTVRTWGLYPRVQRPGPTPSLS